MNIISVENPRKNHTYIRYRLLTVCNFSCSYCPTNLHDGASKGLNYEKVIDFLEKVKNHYINKLGRNVTLELTGGEPTSYPKLIEILQYCNNNNIQVILMSNGFIGKNYWERILNFKHIKVLFTYHVENFYLDRFIQNGKLLKNNLIKIHLPMSIDYWNECVEIYKKLCNNFSSTYVMIKPLLQEFKTSIYPYTQSQLEFIDNSYLEKKFFPIKIETLSGDKKTIKPEELISGKENKFKGLYCNNGVESLTVHSSGLILRAECGRYDQNFLGNIIDITEENLPSRGQICQHEFCGCLSDIYISKKLPNTI